MIEARGLGKTFQQGDQTLHILHDLNLAMSAGATLAIVGQSGSGKSTLLSLLAGLDRPTSGSIALAGQDLNALNEASLTLFRATQLAIVFQQFHLMSTLTALENVRLPLELTDGADAEARAQDALASVGLAARATHFPTQLSGGERQRVAIARAMAMEPKILFADEPSGSLDTATGRQIMDLLFELVARHRTTFILVTHNEELASRCARRLLLADGRLTPA